MDASSEQRRCSRCNAIVEQSEQKFCTNCGHSLSHGVRQGFAETMTSYIQELAGTVVDAVTSYVSGGTAAGSNFTEVPDKRGAAPEVKRDFSRAIGAYIENFRGSFSSEYGRQSSGPAGPGLEEPGMESGLQPAAELERPSVHRSLREILFELGLALADLQDYKEASRELERALKTEGEEPPGHLICNWLGKIYEAADEDERAFRCYLEAGRLNPERLSMLLGEARRLLTVEVARSAGPWVLEEWGPQVTGSALPEGEWLQVILFLGLVHLHLEEYQPALDRFRQAVDRFPDIGAAIGRYLPAAMAGAEDGYHHFILARIYQTFGSIDPALEQVEQALQMGVAGDNYPEAPVQQLKAELLESAGNRDEAVQWYCEAGRSYRYRDELETAVRLLEHAGELNPRHAPTWWELMESLRMLDQKERLEESRAAWERGISISYPDLEYSWAYLSRALINERAVFWSLEESRDAYPLYLEAAALVECSLLSDPGNVQAWAYLGRLFLYLNLYVNSLEATAEAVRLDPRSGYVLENRAEVLISTGSFAEAEATLKTRLDLGPSDFADGLKALLFSLTDRYEEALKILDKTVEKYPDSAWHLLQRAFCHEQLGHEEFARKDLESAWRTYDPEGGPSFEQGWNAYKLGRFSEAIGIFQKLTESPTEVPGSALRFLGLCQLAGGDLESGKANLAVGIGQAVQPWRLDDLAKSDLAALEKSGAERKDRGELERILQEVHGLIAARKAELKKSGSSAIEELRSVLEDSTGGWAQVAGLSGLGRILRRQSKYGEAVETYRGLVSLPQDSTESRNRLANIIGTGALSGLLEDFERLAAELLRNNEPSKALEQCLGPALELARSREAKDPGREARILGGMGYAFFLQNDGERARKYFGEAVSRQRDGEFLGTLCRTLLSNAAQYWNLEQFLSALQNSVETPEGLASVLPAVRRSLVLFLTDYFSLSAQAAKLTEFRTIRVEIDESLPPPEAETDWALLGVEIPAMRERFRLATGIEVPGIDIRTNAGFLGHGFYRIMLRDVPLAYGQVEAGRRFCPRPVEFLTRSGIAAEALKEGLHPVSGEKGSWVAETAWPLIDKQGLELWTEPLSYMVFHIEGLLRFALTDIAGVQEIENLLERWRRSEGGEELIRAALPDEASRLDWVRVLRALLVERVPLTDLRSVLEGFRDFQGAASYLQAKVRALRLRLKPILPGNEAGAVRLELGAELEQRIARGMRGQDGGRFLAMSEEEIRQLISEIVSRAQSSGADTLVVRDPELRPFVSRLTPMAKVLSEEEVLERVVTHEPAMAEE